MSTTFVYFIRSAEDGPVRVGTSSRVTHDLRHIQRNNALPLEVLCVTPGSKLLEDKVHRLFLGDRLHGDWYQPSDSLMAFIGSLPNVAGDLGLTSAQLPGGDDIAGITDYLLSSVSPHLYVLRAASGPVRIGFSWTVESHLRILRECVPEELELVTLIECSPSVVDQICEDLSPYRIRGQWFQPTLEVQLVIDTLPERISSGRDPASFYGGRKIRRLLGEQVEDQSRWLHADLESVFRRSYAQFASIVHLHSGAVVVRRHLTVVEAQDILREEIRESRERISGICLFRRAFDTEAIRLGHWRHSSSIGDCPGSCSIVL